MFKNLTGKIPIIINFILAATLLVTTIGCIKQGESPLTILSIAAGEVTVSKGGNHPLLQVNAGTRLEAGDVIQSGNASSATITFFDGSTIELGAGTQLEIASLNITKSGTTTILLKQKLGETVSHVVKLIDPKSRYEIETISAVAAVKGSTMIVTVEATGATSVGNEEGTISIIAKGVEVAVPVGSHVVALPGQPPSQPAPGTRPTTITTPVYADPTGDLFDKNGAPTTGENYLDIAKSQVSLTAGIYTVHIELNEHCPEKTTEPTTFIEWDILLDTDNNANTGTKWPLIGNDIGYDYMGRVTLGNSTYGQGLLKVASNTWSDIDYIVAVFNYAKVGNILELYLPAEAIGNPDSFHWIIAVRKYLNADPPNQPSVSDKSPNEGHYQFP
jgi:hypothetical protein